METKVCVRCNTEKSVDNFLKHYKYNYYISYCRPCNTEYKREHARKQKEKNKYKVISNNENQLKTCCVCKIDKPATNQYFRIRFETKEFRNECIECQKEYDRQQYLKYQDKKKEKNKAWWWENREEQLKLKKEYFKKPEVKIRTNKRCRDRYRTDADYRWSVSLTRHIRSINKRNDFNDMWSDVKDVYDMYGINYHIDHRIPKNWFIVGTKAEIVNDLRNLQVVDWFYNLSKKDRWYDEVSPDYLEVAIPHIKKKFISKIENPQVNPDKGVSFIKGRSKTLKKGWEIKRL